MFKLLILLCIAGETQLIPVKFRFEAPNAEEVSLAGTFNGWSTTINPMKDNDKDGVWELTLYLKPGRYEYKFVVNGSKWYEDPKSQDYVPDGFGGRNSVVVVLPQKSGIHLERGDGIIFSQCIEFSLKNIYFLVPLDDKFLYIRLKLFANDIDSVYVTYTDTAVKLDLVWENGVYEYWDGMVSAFTPFRFRFKLIDGTQSFFWPDTFLVYNKSLITPVPQWVYDAIIYQIFPERFFNGNKNNDPPGTKKWEYEPVLAPWGWSVFYGGDLEGIIQKLNYLDSLGVNCLYLNPIFESPANHKYEITDYYNVDDNFGGNVAFDRLVDSLKAHGIKVILDGVFNHSSDNHPFFEDVRHKGKKSPYYNWYTVYRWPFPDKFTPQDPPKDYYKCWWGFGDLPELNYENQKVKEYFLDVAQYWVKRGINGWRLDVANEIPHEFWAEFRKTLKTLKKDVYIVGEIWGDAALWLRGGEFDGVMNYIFRTAILDLLKVDNPNVKLFYSRIFSYTTNYPYPIVLASWNLLGSHDTPRIFSEFSGNMSKMKVAIFLQYVLPGVPTVYYGDEIGMEGGKDPDCRRCMIWDENSWEKELLNLEKRMIALRKRVDILQKGTLHCLYNDPNVIILERKYGKNILLIIVNPYSEKRYLSLRNVPMKFPLVDMISGKVYKDTSIELSPYSYLLLKEKGE